MEVARTPKQMLSELIAEAVREHAGAVGVLVRDVLPHDRSWLLQRLNTMHDEEGFPELRIAYLLGSAEGAAIEAGINNDVFSTRIEQAERWRNERDLEALIVVIARGDEVKLSSLEDFGAVTSEDLKRALVDRAMGGPAGQNDVQTHLWWMFSKDQTVGLGQLVDYYLSLEGKVGTDFKHASCSELHWLGLLPDPALFDDPEPSAIRKRLKANREIVERLQMLTPKDRRTIKEVVEAETEIDQKEKLREALEQLHRTRSVGGALGFIDLYHAQLLVKARTKKSAGKTVEPRRPETERAADVASEALVNPDRVKDLTELLDNLQQRLEEAEATSVRTEKIRTPLSKSSTESLTTVRLDVVNLIAKMLDDGVYGGLISIDLDEINELLRRFNAQEHVQTKWMREDLRNVLDEIGEVVGAGRKIANRFAAYDRARTAILPYLVLVRKRRGSKRGLSWKRPCTLSQIRLVGKKADSPRPRARRASPGPCVWPRKASIFRHRARALAGL